MFFSIPSDTCSQDRNILTDYYLNVDAHFRPEDNIREFILYETFIFQDTVRYTDKPVYIFRYDNSGKRIHGEQTTWIETGAVSGSRGSYWDDFGDSIVSISYEKLTGSVNTDYKIYQVCYRFNDTLSQTIRKQYQFGELTKTEDLGIADSRAHLRKQAEEKNKNSSVTTETTPCVYPTPDLYQSIAKSCYYYGYEAPRPLIENVKDSLGRVIKSTEYTTFYSTNNITAGVPYKCFLAEYYSSTSMLTNYVCYDQYNAEEFNGVILHSDPENEKYDFPRCFDEECIYYQVKAEDFIFDMPQKVTEKKKGGYSRELRMEIIR